MSSAPNAVRSVSLDGESVNIMSLPLTGIYALGNSFMRVCNVAKAVCAVHDGWGYVACPSACCTFQYISAILVAKIVLSAR